MKQKLITRMIYLIILFTLFSGLGWLAIMVDNHFDDTATEAIVFDKGAFFKCHVICSLSGNDYL